MKKILLGLTALGGWWWWTGPRNITPRSSVQRAPLSNHPDLCSIQLRYWALLRRKTLGLVRPVISGGGVDITFLGRWVLIHLGSPTVEPERVSWPIGWGFLVGSPGGFFAIQQEEGELVMRLEGFRPSLPGWLYLLTQYRVHCWLGNRLLKELDSFTATC